MSFPITIDEYKKLLSELTRIRALREKVPQPSDRAMWLHKDIDTLIYLIYVQGQVMSVIHQWKEEVDIWVAEIERQKLRIEELQRIVEERCP